MLNSGVVLKLAPHNAPIPLHIGSFNTEKRTGKLLGRGTAVAWRA
jgi:hypothetical protein